jgi:hypothetical protein
MDTRVVKADRSLLSMASVSKGYSQQEKQAALSVLHEGKYSVD